MLILYRPPDINICVRALSQHAQFTHCERMFQVYTWLTIPLLWVKKCWLPLRVFTQRNNSVSRLSRPVYPNIFSLPYPEIRLFIYEYSLSLLSPPIPQKKFFFFLISLGWVNNQTTQINLMTFIGFYFLSYILQFISIFYNSSLKQDQNKSKYH
jgi:hypothetical protein